MNECISCVSVGHRSNRTYLHPFSHQCVWVSIDTHGNRGQALQERNRGLEDTQKEVAAALEAKSAAIGALEEERRALKYVS